MKTFHFLLYVDSHRSTPEASCPLLNHQGKVFAVSAEVALEQIVNGYLKKKIKSKGTDKDVVWLDGALERKLKSMGPESARIHKSKAVTHQESTIRHIISAQVGWLLFHTLTVFILLSTAFLKIYKTYFRR